MPARPQSEGPLLTQQFTISISRPDGTPISVVVTKKRVKNFNLRVTSSGEVHASAPLGASRERIEAFVKRNSTWIVSRLAKREQHQATAREPLSTSSVIALWGKPITVQDALDHNFASPAPRPKQATFASFMGTDVRRAPSPHQPALYDRGHRSATRHRARIRNHNECRRFPRLRAQHENALGIMHAQDRSHSHRTRTCRVSHRVSRHGCRPRARPLARAKPQSAVSRPARQVLPQQ